MPVRNIKRRYMAFKVVEPPGFSVPELRDLIAQTILKFQNTSSTQLSNFRIIGYDPSTCIGVIRCGHLYVNILQTILEGLRFRKATVKVKVVTVSGTLRALRSRLHKH